MRKIWLFFVPLILCANNSSSLYKSLNPRSLSHQLIFFELYPDTEEGQDALKQACSLLHIPDNQCVSYNFLKKTNMQGIIGLVNNQAIQKHYELNDEEIAFISSIASYFPNRKLKGYSMWDEEGIRQLESNEIDIARAILLPQLKDKKAIQAYEANLDLMALQIQATMSKKPTDEEKIHAINQFIFFDMRFRFPPHSVHAKDVDLYTFLPSVMDSRRGVCLGVSMLYLCLAQRLNLTLEPVTPPGHIFLRYKKADGSYLNIENTARGIHLPTSRYLGIETKAIPQNTLKETIGMVFINQASILWGKQDYPHAEELYEKAKRYLDDYTVNQLLAYTYLFNGKTKQAETIFKTLKDEIPTHGVTTSSIIEDYLDGYADAEAIKSIFQPVDETRKSIENKQKQLEKVCKRWPKFRAGLLQLAGTWLQIGRLREALPILEKCAALNDNDPLVNYYLSIIYLERFDYNNAWQRYLKTKACLATHDHYPKALEQIEMRLRAVCPQPHSAS